MVLTFVERLIECILPLRDGYFGAARSSAGEPLQLLPRAGGSGVRSGRLPGVGDFELHGSGCRVVLLTGGEIDFDWDDHGRETFDGWRLARFAQSVGELTREAELVAAARSMRQLSEVRLGWFVLLPEASDVAET